MMPPSRSSSSGSGRSGRRAAVAVAVVTAALATSTTVGRASSTVGADVAAALAAVPGSKLLVDDSSVSACMTGAAEAIAFRADRIVLRTTATNPAAAVAVGGQLVAAGWPAGTGVAGVERITFPVPGPDLVPVVVVTMTKLATKPEQVVALARALTVGSTRAAPDIALPLTGGPLGMWPTGYPEGTKDPLPTPRAVPGTGVEIALYDTGVPSAADADLPPNLERWNNTDTEIVDRNGDLLADLYFAGHSPSISSTIETMAPGAVVSAARITEANGVPTDVSATKRMVSSLRAANTANAWPDIIVAPFGSAVCDGMEPPGLEMVAEAVERHDQTLVLAAAGNRSTDRPFYPAAFPDVVAVGSLDTDTGDGDGNPFTSPTREGPRSSFSNHGAWVDAWVGGEAFVTHHLKGYAFEAGLRPLDGRARVSGTSFATPHLAAIIAGEMKRTGRTAQDVWANVLSPTGIACPTSGGGIAVALTSLNAAATDPAPRGTVSRC